MDVVLATRRTAKCCAAKARPQSSNHQWSTLTSLTFPECSLLHLCKLPHIRERGEPSRCSSLTSSYAFWVFYLLAGAVLVFKGLPTTSEQEKLRPDRHRGFTSNREEGNLTQLSQQD